MDQSRSLGLSWADQWDEYGDPSTVTKSKSGGGGSGSMKKGVEKTKVAAATGLRKVKEGTSHGLQWIKDKYSKRNQKKY